MAADVIDGVKRHQRWVTKTFGFADDPLLTPRENATNILLAKKSREYFFEIKNMQSHNLCTLLTAPFDHGNLLGLGLKFCFQKRLPPAKHTHAMTDLRHNVRIRKWITKHGNKDMGDPEAKYHNTSYNPKVYIKTDWNPPKADEHIEKSLDDFEKGLIEKSILKNISWEQHLNITEHQYDLLNLLGKHDYFIIVESDKNLGPVIMERAKYIRMVLDGHLLDTNTYRRLGPGELDFKEACVRISIHRIMLHTKIVGLLTNDDEVYITRALRKCKRITQFYINIKIHKEEIGSRPVSGGGGTILAAMSKLVDAYLQPLTEHLPTYIRNWEQIKQQLEDFDPLPPGAKLFTADATAMYTNICTDHSIEVLKLWLNKLGEEGKLEDNFPTNMVIQLTELIMRNNYFQFGDTEWIQLTGTAMGTPIACIYATLYYAWKETDCLLPLFKSNLLYHARFIDDIVGIWLPGPDHTYAEYCQELENFGILKWKASKLEDSVIILDLQLKIGKDRKIEFETYQKPMNRYLYVPGRSLHPKGGLRSTCLSMLERFWNQNTKIANYIKYAGLLFERQVNRGRDPKELSIHFTEAAQRIDDKASGLVRPKPKAKILPSDTAIFHQVYHPGGLTQGEIKEQFHRTCNFGERLRCNTNDLRENEAAKHPNINRLLIARSRPMNLKDKLCPSKLYQADGQYVSQVLHG